MVHNFYSIKNQGTIYVQKELYLIKNDKIQLRNYFKKCINGIKIS